MLDEKLHGEEDMTEEPEQVEDLTGELTEELAEESTEEPTEEPSRAYFEDGADRDEPREETQKKKKKTSAGTIVAIIVAAGIFLGILAIGAYLLFFRDASSNDPTDEPGATPADSTTEAGDDEVLSGYGNNDVTALSDYAVLAADPDSETMQAVVAVNANGDAILTNAQLQILYWMEFYQFLNSYGSYASMFGLDYTLPLAGQSSLMENRTWEQYFLESATLNYNNYYALQRAAEAEGYTLPEDLAESLEDVLNPDGEFAQAATEDGFASPDAYLQAQFGDGTNVTAYYDYLYTYYLAMSYYDDVVYNGALEAITDDDVESYYDENAEAYAESGVLKMNNVSVRHILLQPEGDKDSETGDWSEEAWAAALQAAEDVLALWQDDPTEEHFAELANEYTDDTGSNTNGGLYEDFAPGDMVAGFDDWCFEADRAEGDVEIVQSEFGYHIILFKGQTETRAWFDDVKNDMISESTGTCLDELCARYPVEFDYTKVRLFDMVTKSVEEAEADASSTTEE